MSEWLQRSCLCDVRVDKIQATHIDLLIICFNDFVQILHAQLQFNMNKTKRCGIDSTYLMANIDELYPYGNVDTQLRGMEIGFPQTRANVNKVRIARQLTFLF